MAAKVDGPYQQPPERIDVDQLNGRLYTAIRDGLVELVGQDQGRTMYACTEHGLVVGRVRCTERGWDPDQLSTAEMLCLVAYDVVLEEAE